VIDARPLQFYESRPLPGLFPTKNLRVFSLGLLRRPPGREILREYLRIFLFLRTGSCLARPINAIILSKHRIIRP
jgi:hypothetical protein